MVDGFAVQNHLSPAHVDGLLRLYGNEWWTKARTRSEVERMLSGTDLLFAAIEQKTDTLAAFARVLTDGTYLAVVLDVIVAPSYRSRGLGRLLMECICAHPTLATVGSIELGCQPELVPFYQQWGFSEEVGRSRLMRRTSNPLLKSAAAQQATAPDGPKG